ncbi:recombinase family protein [Lacinutrix sp. 5H-3-7-4]|uniref:recombinase family protein n=1 Tax=Lacinutrix sp. (strain 5H-3-7-4) TaxID=983544 RepID=UPI00020A38ED|nr:recombinase family protein [Lacinutrix sp. 5H-3-7-4]AEH02123.1 Resolvase domain protein [Lacinutrix sp. 5H-3-7-4]
MLAVYIRLSKEDDSSNSINNQLREAKEYIETNLIKKYKIYNEGEGFSGTLRVKERPQLSKLMKDIDSGVVTSVWMRKQDRLARLGMTVLQFADSIVKNDVNLYFGDKGEVDLTDPIQMFHITVMAGVDALKPAQQSKATRKAIKDNFAEGLSHGKSTYGFTKDVNRKIIKDDEESKIIELIYSLSLEGNGTQKIANILNEKGIKTQYAKIAERFEKENIPLELSSIKPTYKVINKYTGKHTELNKANSKWKAGTIYSILVNKQYMGVRTRKEKKKNEMVFIEYKNIPVIIQPHIWEKVQVNLKKNRSKSGKKETYNYLLKGLIICGRCGRNYYGRHRPPKQGQAYSKDNYYMCSSKRNKETNCGNRSIDITFIQDFIWLRFFRYKELNELINKHFQETDTKDVLSGLEQRLKKLNNKLSKYDRERQNTIKLNAKEWITIEQAELDLKRVNKEENQTKSEIRNVKEQIANYGNSIRLKEQQNELNNIQDKISFLDKKELVNKYIKEIVINHIDDKKYYEIVIKFNIDIVSEKYIVTTFKKEVFRVVDGFGIFTHKMDLETLEGRHFTNLEKTTVPKLNKLISNNKA